MSISHWCFDDMSWSGCFDAVRWNVSFLPHGGLCLRLWRASRILGAWGFSWHLVLGVSAGTDTLSSLPLEAVFAVGGVAALRGVGLIWTQSLEYCVPVASTVTTVPLDYRVFSCGFFINMTD